jgi:hypothetical protein
MRCKMYDAQIPDARSAAAFQSLGGGNIRTMAAYRG